jgi:hypothetical protein
VHSFVKGPVGQTLGGSLEVVATTALPAVCGVLGSMVLPKCTAAGGDGLYGIQ